MSFSAILNVSTIYIYYYICSIYIYSIYVLLWSSDILRIQFLLIWLAVFFYFGKNELSTSFEFMVQILKSRAFWGNMYWTECSVENKNF